MVYTCDACGSATRSQNCQECGKPIPNWKRPVSASGTPLDALDADSSVILKRFEIKDLKLVKPVPGFSTYTLKPLNDGSGWALEKVSKAFQGHNLVDKYVLGKESDGFVYYLREGAIPLSYDWPVLVGGREHNVVVELSLQVENSRLFIDAFKDTKTLSVALFKEKLGNALRHQLDLNVVSHKDNYINFSLFESGLQSFAQQFIRNKELDVIELTVSAVEVIDETLKSAEKAKKKLSIKEEEFRHKIEEEHRSTRFVDEQEKQTSIQKLEKERDIALATLRKEKEVADKAHQRRLDQVKQEHELKSVSSGYESELTLQELNQDHLIEKTGIEQQIVIVGLQTDWDAANAKRTKQALENEQEETGLKEKIATIKKRGEVERECTEDKADIDTAMYTAKAADAPQNNQTGPEQKSFTIKKGETGHSYETIIGPYLEEATSVVIEEPWIVGTYQVKNFIAFCETVAKRKSIRKITLITKCQLENAEDQPKVTDEIIVLRDSLKAFDVELEVQFNQRLHDRSICIDNGWKVLIGQGLHFFSTPGNWFHVGTHDYYFRKCRETNVDIIRI